MAMPDRGDGTGDIHEAAADEGFLTRWSRRKRDEAPDAQARPESVDADGTGEPSNDRDSEASDDTVEPQSDVDTPERFDDVDFDALDETSDYSRFMGNNVPDDIRNRALDKLWTSDPMFSRLDGLTDYSEDFTDAALAVPLGALKTAYKVGQGFLSDEEVVEWEALGRPETAGDDTGANEDVIAASSAGAAAASAIKIRIESPDQDDVRGMFEASEAYSNALYPAESNHPVSPDALIGSGAVFVVARGADGAAIGCGAVLCTPDENAELKRMWVDPQVRGAGLGRRILNTLIAEAEARQVRMIRLETGTKQPEAIGLYRASGFEDCPPFGSYTADPNSIFMARETPE